MSKEKTSVAAVYIYCMIALALGILIGKMIPSEGGEGIVSSLSQGEKRTSKPLTEGDGGENPLNSVMLSDGAEVTEEPDTVSQNVTGHISALANDHAGSRAESWAEKFSGEYADKLAELGIPDTAIPGILEHRLQLVELSSIDKVFRQRMQSERLKHLDAIKQNTTPEQYEEFVEYERLKGPGREFTKMEEKGFHAAGSLNQDEQLMLKSLLADHNVLTTEAWDGSLDPLPNPLVGVERVTDDIIQRIERINRHLPDLLADMERVGFDIALRENVHNYYLNQVEGMQNGYDNIFRRRELSPEELMQELKDKNARMRQEQAQQDAVSNRVQEQFDNITNN